MKEQFLYIGLVLFCCCCSKNKPGTPVVRELPSDTVKLVNKTVSKKIFAHLMPWFETKGTDGRWGIHWAMANRNPDILNSDGSRQIATHYYPLTGPYASGDTDIIEYQLLLMKLSGIDGVFIDWPGIMQQHDYPLLVKNTEKIISVIRKTGLTYAIVYEDQNINIVYGAETTAKKIQVAQQDMKYLETNCFDGQNYEKLNGSPLLLVFGPQTFNKGEDWRSIFSVLRTTPAFFTLWGMSGKASGPASGEFAWINPDHTVSLNNFYANSYSGIKMGSAYPGFHTYYAEGGWGGPTFKIEHNGLNTFRETLNLAFKSNVKYVQIPTWNDYGEGTMIEPTREFGYGFLTTLQKEAGVPYTQTDLELVTKLYEKRKKYVSDVIMHQRLDSIFNYIVSLQTGKATELLNRTD